MQGSEQVAETSISTGREGNATPTGKFHVIRKDPDHRSGLYGDYVDADGRVVMANVDVRKNARPPNSHYVGASMPWFVEFKPGFGLHEGHRPGYPASHGCVRLSPSKAKEFYNASMIGTSVTVRP
jgi:lipoprotein-anchoring transpeptidase ErfK/SrfK